MAETDHGSFERPYLLSLKWAGTAGCAAEDTNAFVGLVTVFFFFFFFFFPLDPNTGAL